MLVQQYAHRLPADYPMERIRERVAARAPLWAATPGLGFKAFALREGGRVGASGRFYTSIYLWHDAAAALDFFTDERFETVIAGFGRPPVETMLPLAARAKGDAQAVRWLVREDVALDPDIDLRRLRETETARVAEVLARPDVRGAMAALDLGGWRLVRYTLGAAPDISRGLAYEVAPSRPSRMGFPHEQDLRPCR